MTEQQVRELMEASARRGHPLTEYQSKVYLQATEMLVKEPGNDLARDVVVNYSRFITYGTTVESFAEFQLPCPETEEEREQWRRYAELP